LLDSSIACVPWRPCRGGEAEHPMVHHRFPYDRYSDIFGYVFRRYSGRYYIIIYIYIYNIYIPFFGYTFYLYSIWNIAIIATSHMARVTKETKDRRSLSAEGARHGGLGGLGGLGPHDGWDGLAFRKDYKVMETLPWSRLRSYESYIYINTHIQ
jgi:hypothetical protein